MLVNAVCEYGLVGVATVRFIRSTDTEEVLKARSNQPHMVVHQSMGSGTGYGPIVHWARPPVSGLY